MAATVKKYAGQLAASSTTYLDQSKEQRNFGYRVFIGASLTPPPQPFDVLKPYYTRDADILTEELRLSSTEPDGVQWTVGGFYRKARIVNYNTFYFALPGAPGTPLPALIAAPNKLESESGAVFGDANYQFAGRLTLGAGIRYYEDDQEYTTTTFQIGTFKSTNPRVYAQYKLTGEANLYTSAAKGFRSGGFNALNQPRYDPEHVWTYELGTKFSALQGRLSADVAVYYSDYGDYQISGFLPPPAPPINIISNAGDARIRGIEAALTWRPSPQWLLAVNGNYLKSEFVKIDTLPAASGLPSSPYVVGDSLDLFPKYRYTVSAQRDFMLGGKAGSARLDYNEQGRMSSKSRSAGPWYFAESDIINLVNLDVSLQWSEHLSLSVFGQNLLNDRGYLDPLALEQTAARMRPRTYGVGFGFSF